MNYQTTVEPFFFFFWWPTNIWAASFKNWLTEIFVCQYEISSHMRFILWATIEALILTQQGESFQVGPEM